MSPNDIKAWLRTNGLKVGDRWVLKEEQGALMLKDNANPKKDYNYKMSPNTKRDFP
jgi:hypothetical protein